MSTTNLTNTKRAVYGGLVLVATATIIGASAYYFNLFHLRDPYAKYYRTTKRQKKKKKKVHQPPPSHGIKVFRNESSSVCGDSQAVILPGLTLMGQDKWLGGVGSPDGKYVYGVPGHHKRVLRIEVATGKYDIIGPTYRGPFKWLRGAAVPSTGACYCMPSNSKEGILKIDKNSIVSCVGKHVCNPQQVTSASLPPADGDWQWHGGVLAKDNHLYAIPCNATGVLKIDPSNDKCTVLPIDGSPKELQARQKWYGGIIGYEGRAIYGIPQCARGVLRIDVETQKCTIIGTDVVQSHGGSDMGWKWHGGFYSPTNHIIYGIPSNADAVLCINTITDEVRLC
eukprot:g895.t1